MDIMRKYPCPEYDIPGTQAWLEQMAREGYVLCPDDTPVNCAGFCRGEAKALRYRLTPAEKVGFWFPYKTKPSPEAMELSRQMGWEYVCNRSTFHIFVSDDPNAPELETDTAVTAMALSPTVRHYLVGLICAVLCVIVCGRWRDTVYYAVQTNSFLYLLHPMAWAGVALLQLLKLLELLRLRHNLRSGSMQTGNLHWRLLRISQAALLSAAIVFALGLFAGEYSDPTEHADNLIRYEDVRPELPFSDAVTLFPDFENREESLTAESWATFLTPENWRLSDEGLVQSPEDGELTYNLQVRYFRFHDPVFARLYAWELRDRAEAFASYEALPLDTDGYDFAAACNILNGIAVLLQQDEEVIFVYLRLDDGSHFITEQFYTADMLSDAVFPGREESP